MEVSDIQRLDFGKRGFGCKHYRRRCKIRAPCCNKIFPCRHCHNEATSMLSNPNDRHELVRHDVKQIICSVCDTEQQVAHICSNCGVKMGEYFCEVCNFYDDETEKGQFHCKDCGICRVGGSENFFHCQKCGSCYSVGLRDNHLCVENSMRHNCPICYEYLFDTLKNTTVLKCGHTMHLECFHEMTKHDRFGCPICSKSVFDLSKTWKRTDVEVMECFRWLKVAIFIFLFAVSGGTELKITHKDRVPIYNHTLATILVEYASAVYMSDLTQLFTWTCSRCDDMTEGFEIIELIVDVQNCLQAFVGVARDLNAIVIAFRGTQEHSIQNWIEDLFWKQLDLNYPDMPDAMVHHGFYYAYHNTTIRPCVLQAVKRAKELYGDIGIMVTGHSMGGAMASFCVLDLMVNYEAQNVQLMTFGQPRIGNTYFASYFSQIVPNTIRVTNEHDMVPHLPPYYPHFTQKTYHHFPREVWLHNLGFGTLMYTVEKVCDDSGEDPSCSRSVSGNSISDHLEYYGVELQADTWSSCRIVMDPRVVEYRTTDLNGNFVLSKDPATSVLKLNTPENLGSNSI